MERSSILAFIRRLKGKRRCCFPEMVVLAVRMKFSMVMPATEIGFWKERKIPSFALLSTDRPVISWPSK